MRSLWQIIKREPWQAAFIVACLVVAALTGGGADSLPLWWR